MDLAVTPAAPDTLLAAYSSGGVWQTRDGAGTWSRITSIESANYVSSVAISATDSEEVFVGLGAPGYTLELERGVLRSRDGGETWQAIGPISERADAIYDILVDPFDSRHLTLSTEDAVFVTFDGGQSWAETLDFPGETENWWDHLSQLVGHPENGMVAWVAHRDLGVFKTFDGGVTWARSDQGIDEGGGVVLAVSESDPDLLFAERELEPWPRMGVYRSDDGGSSWTRTTVVDGFHQGRYDMAIAVHPSNPDHVILANVGWQESTDGGVAFGKLSWTSGNERSTVPHADHLAIAFKPGEPDTVYSGNDGGVWRSVGEGAFWEKVDQGVRSNLAFNLGVAPGATRLYLTSGDYGGKTTDGDLDWEPYAGYEWQFYAVDPNDPSSVYTSTGGDRLVRIEEGAPFPIPIDPCPGQNMRYDRPIDFDPEIAGIVYAGCLDLRRSSDRGDTWQSISPTLSENPNWGLTDFQVAPSDGDVLWVATERLWHSTDGGASWQSRNLPAYPQDLAVDPTDPSTVYVGAAFRQLKRYTRYGARETQLWGNLPDTAIRRVVVDPTQPSRLFAGTDVGVFVSPLGDGVWYRLGRDLPWVLVWDLDIDGTTLFASGPQGVWSYDFGPASCGDLAEEGDLCLENERFLVSASYASADGASNRAQGIRLTDDSGVFWFYDSSNVELIVKLLDACGLNQSFWVFAGGLTDVEVELRVTDTVTGAVQLYRNPRGRPFAPIQDTGAFATCGSSSSATRPGSPRVSRPLGDGEGVLQLRNGRFEVEIDWQTADDEAGAGEPVAFTEDTGYFWFFDEQNVELVVKVLDACALNQHFWVFAGGLTSVETQMVVTDTVTGEQRTYQNPQGVAFQPVQDTNALPCSP